MTQQFPYSILAYYCLIPIEDPHAEVARHKEFLSGRDVTCRIYISEQGINGQFSAANADAKAYIEWMHQRPEFANVCFKIHPYHENVFPRLTIKYRKQLVALDADWDPSLSGGHVSPQVWKEMLETQKDRILIDVRNDYEWKIGHFEGAELPQCETFRDFNSYADDLKQRTDAIKTPVMMYCTGGIRCELYSSILKEKGFEKVYQLDGGVIGYGLDQGNAHWLGKLFVFDDRMAIPISEDRSSDSPIIGTCHHCGTKNEHYYNCANMDCNNLFLCCPQCLKQFSGCCCDTCLNAPRVRPYHEQDPHKPFKRWYHYENKLDPQVIKDKREGKKKARRSSVSSC